jgi:hypothetical protein
LQRDFDVRGSEAASVLHPVGQDQGEWEEDEAEDEVPDEAVSLA